MMYAGVDASSTTCGWGICSGDGELLASGAESKNGTFGPFRLAVLANMVRKSLKEQYWRILEEGGLMLPPGGKPLKGLKIQVEMPSFFKKGGGARARASVAKGDVAKCAMAAGAVGAELVKAGASVKFVKPGEWKGSWNKKAVLAWSRRTWPNSQFTDRKVKGPWGQDAMEGAALAYHLVKGKLL